MIKVDVKLRSTEVEWAGWKTSKTLDRDIQWTRERSIFVVFVGESNRHLLYD